MQSGLTVASCGVAKWFKIQMLEPTIAKLTAKQETQQKNKYHIPFYLDLSSLFLEYDQ